MQNPTIITPTGLYELWNEKKKYKIDNKLKTNSHKIIIKAEINCKNNTEYKLRKKNTNKPQRRTWQTC